MKALITGASGALGSGLRAYLDGEGAAVRAWDRGAVAVDDPAAMADYLRAEGPDVLFHLATDSQPTGRDNEGWVVNVEWTAHLARLAASLGIRFVFTSSVMVFTDSARGPFMPVSQPDASEGYGYEKAQAEKRVLALHPAGVVARLGWQIGDAPGSNNMIDYFHTQMAEHGAIRASRKWYPACSFIADTAAALARLGKMGRGLYLFDSNTRWTFYDIAGAINHLHGGGWQVLPDDSFVYDQRMIDPRAGLPSLSARLDGLA